MPEDSLYPFLLALSLLAAFYGLLLRAVAAGDRRCRSRDRDDDRVALARSRARGGVTMATVAVERRLPLGAEGKSAPGWWGMVLLIVTEASLFVYLLFSYFYLGSMARGAVAAAGAAGAPAGAAQHRDPAAQQRHHVVGRVGDPPGRARSAAARACCSRSCSACVFLVDPDGRVPAQHVHARDRCVRLAVLHHHRLPRRARGGGPADDRPWCGVRAWLGHFSARRHLAVTNVSWYWHFVDVVWLAVFTSLYLSPRFV